MTLSLVIPVRDDAANLTALLQQASDMSTFAEVIVVDDGSQKPVTVDLAGSVMTRVIRMDEPRGAGAARNRAIPEIATDHVIFFDSDDRFTREFPWLWSDLLDEGENFDFCLFRHHDSRLSALGGWGQLPVDDALWREAAAGHGPLFEVPRARLSPLAGTANYPWNKIYRTDFIRQSDIRFSETLVHNDIVFHWLSFLRARRVLASDRVAAVHKVADDAARLTNRKGRTRFAVFDELDQVHEAIASAPDAPPNMRRSFIRFGSGLFDWIGRDIGAELGAEYDVLVADHLGHWLDARIQAELAQAYPREARLLHRQLGGSAYGTGSGAR